MKKSIAISLLILPSLFCSVALALTSSCVVFRNDTNNPLSISYLSSNRLTAAGNGTAIKNISVLPGDSTAPTFFHASSEGDSTATFSLKYNYNKSPITGQIKFGVNDGIPKLKYSSYISSKAPYIYSFTQSDDKGAVSCKGSNGKYYKSNDLDSFGIKLGS